MSSLSRRSLAALVSATFALCLGCGDSSGGDAPESRVGAEGGGASGGATGGHATAGTAGHAGQTTGGSAGVGAGASGGGTGGMATGGTSHGGAATAHGGMANGGMANGGMANGGMANGGMANGGAAGKGGMASGGVANGGMANGGVANGGVANGGAGGDGGMANGGMANGGAAGGSVTVCPDLVPPLPQTSGPILHVAPGGSDSADGSLAKPFLTLQHALKGAAPGTRVLLADGVYPLTGATTISNVNGTATEPIVVTAEPGATPIFDASSAKNVPTFSNVLNFNKCSYLTLDSITLRNSPTSGLGFSSSSFMTLTRSVVHDTQDFAIEVIGSDFVIAGNEIYRAALMNENDKNGTWWSGVVGSWYVDGTTPTRRVKYLQNHVHDVWGECLNILFVDDVDVIGNDLHDCYSDHVYIDHGADVRVLRNRMYNTKPEFPGPAVGIDDESYPSYAATPEHDILIANNYFGKGLKHNLFRYDNAMTTSPTNTWSHVHVLFNVLEPNPIWFAKVLGSTPAVDGLIAGNIFLGAPAITLQDAAWTVTENDFPGGVPAPFVGMGNFSAPADFVGPTDGTTLAGFATLGPSALEVSYRAEVPLDAMCAPRSSPKTAAGLAGP